MSQTPGANLVKVEVISVIDMSLVEEDGLDFVAITVVLSSMFRMLELAIWGPTVTAEPSIPIEALPMMISLACAVTEISVSARKAGVLAENVLNTGCPSCETSALSYR